MAVVGGLIWGNPPAVSRLLVPLILPIAVAWVVRQERRILSQGVPLDVDQQADARAVGVAEPERVRLLPVARVPLPGMALARFSRFFVGTDFSGTSGLAARYGIYLRADVSADRALLAHEMTHTAQYERLGGIRPFLRQYLGECLSVGYFAASLEVEARERAVEVIRT